MMATMKRVLFVAGIFLLIQAEADKCGPSQYAFTDKWSGGANGNFILTFTASFSSGWTAKIQFSSPVTTLTVWSGKNSKCISSDTCTFSNADYNAAQAQGSTLTLAFGLNFPGSAAPDVVAIYVNDKPVCSGGGDNGGGQTSSTTSTSTLATTTTMSSKPTTPPAGGNQRGVFVPWPNKVLGLYLLLADDFTSFGSNANWNPELFPYQQKGANVLFFSFVNPSTMSVPPAFKTLAKTRGTNASGAVPANTVIIFAIGGIGYSQKYNPWQWLTSSSAAEAMAVEVAKWPSLFGCDGIDLDIENGAGENQNAGPNMMVFIKKLRQMVPKMIISQPAYGFPQIAAETYVINQSFDGNGKNLNGVDSIGLMVYEGTETLQWTKSYTNGPEQGQGVTCRAPANSIILGAPGGISPSDMSTLTSSVMSNNYRGIMVWYSSVKNGFQYGAQDDSTASTAAQDAFAKTMKTFANG